ncbi:hypothetical protein [Corynebacterium falsenii]|uniref:hypothetical protein n=1 Tax=Corynebacterium falsenii TaxID=108486 RepID=UPI0011C21F22|nr:hypothetical protein [Corynebacterium falsenii]
MDNPDKPVVTDDGRMLQPQGHEGIWFETEPDDPWGKYVWRSQKFVGDPLELPVLGESEMSGTKFEGLSDDCNSEVKQRLESIGFEKRRPLEYTNLMECGFRISPEDFFADTHFWISFWHTATWKVGKEFADDEIPKGWGMSDTYTLPTSYGGHECVSLLEEYDGRAIYLSTSELGAPAELESSCKRISYMRQLVDNIS